MKRAGSRRGDPLITTSSHSASRRLTRSQQVKRGEGTPRAITPGTVQPCSHTENIWLRTKRYNASGKVVSGTGGICYLYFPARLHPGQRRALARVGVS